MKKTILLVSVAAVLAACGPVPQLSYVTRFNHLKGDPAGKIFVIAPGPAQQGSLEFAAYAGLVAQELVRCGFRPADTSDAANLLVTFDYGVDGGRSEIWSTPVFAQEQYWQRRYQLEAPIPAPSHVYRPTVSDLHTATVYTRWLRLEILDAENWRRDVREIVFAGRAFSEGGSRNLPQVLPNVIKAMFVDFPGRNGETRPVSISPNGGPLPAVALPAPGGR